MTSGSVGDLLLQVAREGLWLALLVSAPPVLVAWLVGLVVGALQAATQIQEPVVAFVPRLLAVAFTLLVMGPSLAAQLVRFTQVVLQMFPRFVA